MMHKLKFKNAEFEIEIADTFWERFIGLMFQPLFISPLLIKKCSQVHMFFMGFALDLIFLDDDYVVIERVLDIKPWRVSRRVRGATMVLELKIGDGERIEVGEKGVLVDRNRFPVSGSVAN